MQKVLKGKGSGPRAPMRAGIAFRQNRKILSISCGTSGLPAKRGLKLTRT